MNIEHESLEDTLNAVATKLPMLLDRSRPRPPLPIDCVALDGVEVLGEGYVHPSCSHPDRGGPVFGCVLVEEGDNENVVRRKKQAVCPQRVKKRGRGAAALRKRIKEEEEKNFW